MQPTLTKKSLIITTLTIFILCFAVMFLAKYGTMSDLTAEEILKRFFKIALLSLVIAIFSSVLAIFIFKRDFIKGQLETFGKYKYLLRLFVKRDFLKRFRRSFLGMLWSVLSPLLSMIVLTIIFSYLFKRSIENFPVYLIGGQILFGFFSESTNHALTSVIQGASIIRKVYVPKYIFPLSKVFSTFVNFLFALISFFIVFIITRAPFRWTMLLIPVPIIYLFVFSLGVSLILSAVAVFLRDLTNLYSIIITMLNYLTPIFYPVDILPGFIRSILMLNPLYIYINYFRDLTLYGIVPGLLENAAGAAYAVLALFIGAYVFMRQQDKFILYL